MSGGAHIPVMLDEVVSALAPRDGAVYVDGTFGGGSYAAALLARAQCSVYGIDRDEAAIARGKALAERYAPRLTLIHGRFSEMEALLGAHGVEQADGLALDIGVSSFQLDQRERGFSFRDDGPLDMRMDASQGVTAADLVNTLDEAELADILRRYGEEKRAKAVARAIIAGRPIARTGELVAIVEKILGKDGGRIHPATRIFQALRIAVNAELDELEGGLEAAERMLKRDGRLAVVSFHSLEDRIVKQFLAERSGRVGRGSRHMPDLEPAKPATFALMSNLQTPGDAEIAANPRARSARLRVAQRTAAPAWQSSSRGA